MPNGRGRAGAFGTLVPSELRRLGRFAGFLLVLGSLMSLPARFFAEPEPEVWEHLIGFGSGLLGVAFLVAPWERLSPGWLHVAMIAATVEIAASVAIVSNDYAFFYVLVAMFTAYVVRERTALIAYMLFLTFALLAPLLYADDLKEEAHHILVTLPVFLIAALIVRYLRDTLERRQQEYRGFAVEAVTLAERIRGSSAPEHTVNDLEARLGRLAAAEHPQREREPAPEARS